MEHIILSTGVLKAVSEEPGSASSQDKLYQSTLSRPRHHIKSNPQAEEVPPQSTLHLSYRGFLPYTNHFQRPADCASTHPDRLPCRSQHAGPLAARSCLLCRHCCAGDAAHYMCAQLLWGPAHGSCRGCQEGAAHSARWAFGQVDGQAPSTCPAERVAAFPIAVPQPNMALGIGWRCGFTQIVYQLLNSPHVCPL